MTRAELLDNIRCGREIEFRYNGDMYSITQGTLNGKHVISFCKFNEETTEVANAEDILCVTRNGVSVQKMLESISKNDIWIY